MSNSRTKNDTDMKLEPVTKLNKKKMTTSKKFDDQQVSANYNIIVIFPIYRWFGMIQKLKSGNSETTYLCVLTIAIVVRNGKTLSFTPSVFYDYGTWISLIFWEKPTLVLHQYFYTAIRVFQLSLTQTYSIYLLTTYYQQKGLNLLFLQRPD